MIHRIARRSIYVKSLAQNSLPKSKTLNNYIDTLTPAEFERLATSVGRRLKRDHPLEASTIAKEADTNKDGVVSNEELAAWWGRRKGTLLTVSAANQDSPPTRSQLMRLGVVAAIPCFIFGLLDNSIMLIAGDAIENSIGIKFGISAMACAAMGNIIADTLGQVSGGTVENLLRPVLPSPNMSSKQYRSRAAGLTKAIGGAAGIFVGCIIGCFPLLFYDDERGEKNEDIPNDNK